MNARTPLLLLSLLIVVALPSRGGPQDEIKKKQSQVQRLRKDIDAYEKKIRDREKKEHATLDLLDTYDRQSVLLKKLVGRLKEQERELERDIDETRRTIAALGGQMRFLRDHYARYVKAAYKNGETYDLELLLSARSMNQFLIRAEYLKRFSNQRAKDLDRLGHRRDDIEEQNDRLQRQLAEQRDVIDEKAKEEANLRQKANRRRAVLTEIRKDKKNFQKELGRKTAALREIEQLIAKLIEEDRVRREKAVAKEGRAPKSPSVAGGAFESQRGRLRWPVGQGRLVARFGAQENPVLHTVTQNPGVDIAVAVGTPVEAVSPGEVSAIWWLPSFGNLLILNHANGYRTVYAHLSEILVNEGESVGEGNVIAKSGEALSGPLLHFEIWKDRDKQDPEHWLSPKGLSRR
jgi:septal ring factor EnvC (AmiA/AmiB activator)